jgi:hypothetical protein
MHVLWLRCRKWLNCAAFESTKPLAGSSGVHVVDRIQDRTSWHMIRAKGILWELPSFSQIGCKPTYVLYFFFGRDYAATPHASAFRAATLPAPLLWARGNWDLDLSTLGPLLTRPFSSWRHDLWQDGTSWLIYFFIPGSMLSITKCRSVASCR